MPGLFANIPIYPGSKIVHKAETEKDAAITLQTTAPDKEIFEYYFKELLIRGWKLRAPEQEKNTGGGWCFIKGNQGFLMYKNENGIMLFICVE